MREEDPSTSSTAVRRRGRELEVSRPPCLVVLYGGELGRRLELGDEAVRLGRATDCDLVTDLGEVSREHCRIEPADGGYVLCDAGSTNGTFLGGIRLEPGEPVPLESGDQIQVGSLILKYLDGRDVEALYHEEIYRLTIVDALTGLANRRRFDEFLEREAARWRRYRCPLSVLLFDVDHFKAVNDAHGHPAGDGVLRQVAEIVHRIVRTESCLARLAGDEFGLVLPETSVAQATTFAERIRGTVALARFEVGDEAIGELTVSVGIAEMTERVVTAPLLLEEADRRLYAAKRQGRNCVIA